MSNPDSTTLARILRTSRNIAVVGASPNPARPSNWISQYLMHHGYTVFPVNPGHAELFGIPCFPDVQSIDAPLDIVNIFRRSDQVLPIVEACLNLQDLKLIWMQDKVYNPEAAKLAIEAGIPVVMDDCIFRFHSRL